MNAKVYNEHHELQLRDGKEFIQLVADQLQWTNMSGQVFMDIGCGPGTNCPKLLLERFPDLQKIIGIDSEEEMINLAKKIAAYPKIDYEVMDIENSNILCTWQDNISKIVSVYCLHWVKDQTKAFRNIYNLLKASGEAALLFTMSCSFWDCLQDFVQNAKWKQMLQNLETHIPESHFKQFAASHYESLLKEMGFEVILCEISLNSFEFSTEKN